LEKYQDELRSVFKANLIQLTKDLALITLKSPEELEGTSGVMDYLYSIFGENGINIVETMSCWTDTIFVISEDDVQKVIKFLKF
jgi:aspartokinase